MKLQLKLFNLELKYNNPMALILEIRAIMHGIDSIGVHIDIALTPLIKVLYPTYLNYLESLQASGNLKSLTFDTLADKIIEHVKAFGKKTSDPTSDTLYIVQ